MRTYYVFFCGFTFLVKSRRTAKVPDYTEIMTVRANNINEATYLGRDLVQFVKACRRGSK